MAFSLRKMLSNITYFKKPGEDEHASGDAPADLNFMEKYQTSNSQGESSQIINFECTEADSTSKQATSLKLPKSIKNYAAKKGSLSDTDLLNIKMENTTKKGKRRSKKLKLDIKKANESMDDLQRSETSDDVENTPKRILLDCKSSDTFSKRFNKGSFDIFDALSDYPDSSNEDVDIESLTESDTDISIASNEDEIDKTNIKMCRKVDEKTEPEESHANPSASPESFGDVEESNEEERNDLLLNYQMKLEKMENALNKLLSEFKFHVEVSKIFHCKSIATSPTDNIPKTIEEIAFIENISRGISPTGSWNIVMEKEDNVTKMKLKKQLLSMKNCLDEFINSYLKDQYENENQSSHKSNHKSLKYSLNREQHVLRKHKRINNKKKIKHFDFPDFREAMVNLFNENSSDDDDDGDNITNLISDIDEFDKCNCCCHNESPSQTDSGLITKSNERSMSITSSIGNFSLDTSTLTAYSESLDLIISYNSFQDTSLLSSLLQKAAIERITFYVQVHSIQLKCEVNNEESESKNIISFHCPACKTTENEENDLVKHILSQYHCEKIHFLYKTAYIKKCVESGKEIQPSTVLNPMKMYRDENKIVCFGDAMYACSLCFENLIIGESVLIAHCSEPEHVEKKEKLNELLE